MGRKKITIDELREEINEILEDYESDTLGKLREASVAYAKIGKKRLQEVSPKRTGKYSKGWAYADDPDATRLTPGSIIYQKAKPGLPHLLEYGHALRGGGRAPAHPHIQQIEEEINTEFKEKVLSLLTE